MNFQYYYNNVPGVGHQTRNNLIYTSLMSEDQKVFCQWYTTEGDYHKGQNQVVDPNLMDQKFHRDVKYLTLMAKVFPDMVPKILNIDTCDRKIFLEVDGVDFWQQADCNIANYSKVLPDWQEQMLTIIEAHHAICLYKYSMHPSSYFVVDGKLKSINYFFTYHMIEGPITIQDHLSHVHTNRQAEMKKYTDSIGMSWTDPQSLEDIETLCWESFRTNYPLDFIEKAKCIK